MELELIIKKLTILIKELYYKRIILKDYCEINNLSYTSTSRILKRGVLKMNLRTAYNILGLSPERNISPAVLEISINDLLEIKKIFLKGFL
jgi:hypothetical protein